MHLDAYLYYYMQLACILKLSDNLLLSVKRWRRLSGLVLPYFSLELTVVYV